MKFSLLAPVFALSLVTTPAISASATSASRDWKSHPAIVQTTTTGEVYAVGDAHADQGRLAGALLAGGLIKSLPASPDQVKWNAGKAVLVVTGDMIDKWNASLPVITLLRTLQSDAASQGGRVIITMGNHEGEFLADPDGKKTREFADELKAAGQDPVKVAACQGDLGQFLCNLPIGVVVNDWFFSHAGNTGGRSVAELESAIQSGFAKDGFATQELVGDNSILEARLNKKGPNGLPWFMEGSSKTDPQKLLKGYVKKLGVKHLVQGHQYGKVKFPDGKNREEEDFFQRYGLLFLIDSGMSEGIEDSTSTGGVLHITEGGNKAIVICANGKTETLWSKKKDQDSKSQHCGK
ncbi:MAG: hypothetical protein RL748_977 [Pseudomonadota bacterium]